MGKSIPKNDPHVRFWGKSRHDADPMQCPLLTQSGHRNPRLRATLENKLRIALPLGSLFELPIPMSGYTPTM
jgi:hypothetical protein